MITVYGRATSSNVQTVMWAIGELGLRFERLDYGHSFGGVDTPEYLSMNPNGLVPVLRDGDLVLWESRAILRFLGARYGSAPFWPEDPVARAPVDMWAEWGKTTLERHLNGPIFWTMVRTPAARRDPDALTAAIAQFESDLDILGAQIGDGPWVLGPDFTAADIGVGHLLYRWFTLPIERRDRPVLEGYYARLSDRPAFAEHVMVSYEALRAGDA